MNDALGQFSELELTELRTLFFSQSQDIVEELQESLLKLEAGPGDGETLKTIKRHVHTLKGDAGTIGLTTVGVLCHRTEDLLLLLHDGRHQADPELVDLLMSCVDGLQRLLREAASGSDEGDIRDIQARIDAFLKNADKAPLQPHTKPSLTEYQSLEIDDCRSKGMRVYDVEVVLDPRCAEKGVAHLMVARNLSENGRIIRSLPDPTDVDVDRFEKIHAIYGTTLDPGRLEQALALPGITYSLSVSDHGSNVTPGEPGTAALSEALTAAPPAEMLRIEASRVDKIMNLVGELIIGRSMLDRVSLDLANGAASHDAAARLSTVNANLERTLRELQNSVMKMRMVPVNTVFRKFPKIVRDLSLEQGKRIRLDIKGKEAELDKSIVDALGEPLAHIVRNMVDHGIEAPEARLAAGKTEEGTITLRAYHEAAHIVIEASDDGRGIDVEKLKQKAMVLGVLTPEEAANMAETEATALMFHPGLSTADTVTRTSGRGVGMDAVKSAIQNMKGTIDVLSEPGRGTIIRLTLPLTLAVIKALLFDVGSRSFAIPVSSIAEVLRVMPGDLASVNGSATLMVRDHAVSLVGMADLFGIEGTGTTKQFALLIGSGRKRVGLLVDRLVGQQELVIKAVDERQTSSGLVAGASILGDGKVVLILDAPSVIRKASAMEKERVA